MRINDSRLIKLVRALVSATSRLPRYSSKFSRKDFTLQQHVVLLCIKVKTKQNYRDFCDLLAEMGELCKLLELEKIPHWTTLNKAFLRLKNRVLAILLQTENSGFLSIDATGFDRMHASHHYAKRCKIRMKSMKTTLLIDTKNQCIVDLHCTTGRKHDSKIILPLTSRHRFRILCADKGYDDNKVREALQDRGIIPVIPFREMTPLHKALRNSIDMKLYHRRSLSETVNSSIKRKYGSVLYSKNWRSQFKELILKAVVYNIDRKLSIFLIGFLQSHYFLE